MTFEELTKKFTVKLVESEWHKHSWGDGWVQNTVKVDETAFVGPNAIVCGNSKVLNKAMIFDNAIISGDANISDEVWCFGDSEVTGKARVIENASVSGTSTIYGNALISGHSIVKNADIFGNVIIKGKARIYGGVWQDNPIYIDSVKYPITNSRKGHINIGCKEETISWWLSDGIKFARENHLSDVEIEEYRQHIQYIRENGI